MFALDDIRMAILFSVCTAEISQGHSELQNCRGKKNLVIVQLFLDTATSAQTSAEKRAFLLELAAVPMFTVKADLQKGATEPLHRNLL